MRCVDFVVVVVVLVGFGEDSVVMTTSSWLAIFLSLSESDYIWFVYE